MTPTVREYASEKQQSYAKGIIEDLRIAHRFEIDLGSALKSRQFCTSVIGAYKTSHDLFRLIKKHVRELKIIIGAYSFIEDLNMLEFEIRHANAIGDTYNLTPAAAELYDFQYRIIRDSRQHLESMFDASERYCELAAFHLIREERPTLNDLTWLYIKAQDDNRLSQSVLSDYQWLSSAGFGFEADVRFIYHLKTLGINYVLYKRQHKPKIYSIDPHYSRYVGRNLTRS